MALVITICILIILAGISIAMLTGDNGLITKTLEAKEETEISEEKEILGISVIQAMSKNRTGEITKPNLNVALENNVGKGKFILDDGDDEYLVTFVESERTYEVDKDGNVTILTDVVVADKDPGDYTDGGKLDGSEDRPYKINSIEDLIAFHNDGNGNEDKYLGKTVLLMRDLNFKSKSSYVNSENTELFGDYNGDGVIEGIMQEVTKEETAGLKFAKNFKGTFDGQNYTIKNMYINELKMKHHDERRNYVGFIGDLNTTGAVKNLTVEGNIKFGYEGKYIEYRRVGGLIGRNTAGNVENCISNVNIEIDVDNTVSEENEDGAYSVKVGGLIGNNEGTVNKCKSYGKINVVYRTIAEKEITGNPTVSVGGIAGRNENVIRNSINYGIINHKGTKQTEVFFPLTQQIGGICGELATRGEGALVENCINFGNITTETEESLSVGGIIGYSSTSVTETSSNCYNEADIQSTMQIIDSNNKLVIGGIIGNGGTNIEKCYNRGELTYVSSGTTKEVGFIVGDSRTGKNYINCKYLETTSGLITGGAEGKNEDNQGNPIEKLTSFTREDALQLLNQNVKSHNSASDNKWVEWKVQGNSITYIE